MSRRFCAEQLAACWTFLFPVFDKDTAVAATVILKTLRDAYKNHAARDRFAFPCVEVDDLAVVVVRTTLPKCIEQSFLRVIHVSATTVRWIKFDEHLKWPIEWANAARRKDRHNLMSEESTPAADERPCSNPPPVVIYRRRERQFEFDHAGRLHGGVVWLAC